MRLDPQPPRRAAVVEKERKAEAVEMEHKKSHCPQIPLVP